MIGAFCGNAPEIRTRLNGVKIRLPNQLAIMRHIILYRWMESNHRPKPYESSALPLRYIDIYILIFQ